MLRSAQFAKSAPSEVVQHERIKGVDAEGAGHGGYVRLHHAPIRSSWFAVPVCFPAALWGYCCTAEEQQGPRRFCDNEWKGVRIGREALRTCAVRSPLAILKVIAPRRSSGRTLMFVSCYALCTSIRLIIMAQWLPLLTSQSDVDATLESMQQAGVKVLRTWVKPQIVSFGEGYTDEPQGLQCYQRVGTAECARNESDLLPGMCVVMVTILS